jgi:glutamine synthetase
MACVSGVVRRLFLPAESLSPFRSPIFLRGDSFFVPACFVSWKGDALDEKTPLHRAVQVSLKQT